MNIFDFLFPHQAAAAHLRAISNQPAMREAQMAEAKATAALSDQIRTEALKMRIDDLEGDLGFVLLVLAGLLSSLEEKGALTREDVRKELAELDGVDGIRDGKLNIRVLKKYISQIERR